MVTKKEFFSYMSAMYNEDYQDEDLYKAFKTIVKLDNKSQVKELKDINEKKIVKLLKLIR
jgi:hypothetical protein